MKKIILITLSLIMVISGLYYITLTKKYEFGEVIDTFNGVNVYYNGNVRTVKGTHTSNDGYYFGLKYQCVEFVKRYYYQHLNHKMPNVYGHAKDFFNYNLSDGQLNIDRNLIQYNNPSKLKPQVNDLVIFKPNHLSKYGHVAIISKVKNNKVELVHQNSGIKPRTRIKYKLINNNDNWKIDSNRIVGWLRKI